MKFYAMIIALVLGSTATASPTFSPSNVSVKKEIVAGGARATVVANSFAKVAVALDSHARWLDSTGTPIVLGYFDNGLAITELEYVASRTARNYVMNKPATITLSVVGYTSTNTNWLVATPPPGAVLLEIWWVARAEAYADGVWYNGPKVATPKYTYLIK